MINGSTVYCAHAKVLKERRVCLICTVCIVGVDTVDTLVVSTAGKSIFIMGLLQRKSVTDDEKETSVGFVGYLVEALIKQRIMCIPFQLFLCLFVTGIMYKIDNF